MPGARVCVEGDKAEDRRAQTVSNHTEAFECHTERTLGAIEGLSGRE